MWLTTENPTDTRTELPSVRPFSLAEGSVREAMRAFVTQKDYPCIAALKSQQANEFRLGIYEDFGSGRTGRSLRARLGEFLAEQKRTDSPYLSFWAVYGGESHFSEEEFERRMWHELSSLTSLAEKSADWGPHESDPRSRKFAFCLFGEPFFVVGLHPNSSRRARRFGRPALVFNVFRQFAALQRKGAYLPMVRTNRLREMKFDGGVNPMAKKHGEQWEAIQFSGRENSEDWVCPFRFLR